MDSRSGADVKVCRGGVEIWEGDVSVFEPSFLPFGGTVTTHIGRRVGIPSAEQAGFWEVNDVIVLSSPSTSCPVVSMLTFFYLLILCSFCILILLLIVCYLRILPQAPPQIRLQQQVQHQVQPQAPHYHQAR